MKKIIILILVAIGAGLAWWLGSPLFIDKEVNETIEDIQKMAPPMAAGMESISVTERIGTFVGADDFHKGEGTVSLIKLGDKYFVRFEDDFKVTNGPDLFVYFGRDGEYIKDTNLGVLKGNIGSQNYEVSAEINPNDYNEVWVWCRAFSVPFAKAVLN
ncbi:MAG: DM13 domain-containing protein [Candidatus Colwellbacteria bacterium]|nr:DM13 domain-containing protein [Candidatus Colwellbacteria bacterium]